MPIDYWTAFVGCFDDNSILVFEILKSSPFFSRKVGKFGVVIEIKFVNIMAPFFDGKVY